MFTHTSRLFRLAFVTVVALIAISAVSLTVVLTHEDTAMAQDAPWPSKPAATPTAAAPATSGAPAATPAPTSAQTSPVAQNSPAATAKPKTQANRAPLTYTVKKGDNLTVIADWFKLRGYGDLYERNRKTIGGDPNLIKPGQKITVSSNGMTTSG